MATLARMAGLVACGLVAIGFVLFAVDELRYGSETQVSRLEAGSLPAPDPTPRQEAAREARSDPMRELIDDANDVLLAPFTGLTSSRDIWVTRAVPGIAALFFYGFLIPMLANWLPGPKPKRSESDWRTV